MKRYRRGQIFRPPSAAESAAQADAIAAYRARPSRPRDNTHVGQSIIVKTPEDGIPARDEDNVFWAKCKRCIHVDDTVENVGETGTSKLRVDTDETVIVYNLLDEAIQGNDYVQTALTDTGLRYVARDSLIAIGEIVGRPERGQEVPIIRVKIVSGTFTPTDDSDESPSDSNSDDTITYSETVATEETDVYWLDCPRTGGAWNPAARLLIECGQRIAVSKHGGEFVAMDIPLVTVRHGWSDAGTARVYAAMCPAWEASDSSDSFSSDSDTDDYGDWESASWPFAGETSNGPIWATWTGLAWMVTAATCDYDPQSDSSDSSYDSNDPTEGEWLI